MPLKYSLVYKAENTYQAPITRAFWQFLILPEANETQELVQWHFTNDLDETSGLSINGLGFSVIRVHSRKKISKISFTAKFMLVKKEVNPFNFIIDDTPYEKHEALQSIDFRAEHEVYLRKTVFTSLPKQYIGIYSFDQSISIFENLKFLNSWVFEHLYFQSGVTDVYTDLEQIIENRHGVCQDFTHLFCAICREHGIPVRYVSGYLHQGNGYFGDSQMHAWAEAHLPETGWVGFDPTNNILASSNHIKVAHGKDYQDCAPIKGVVYGTGTNKTNHSVEVYASQQ